MLKQSLVFGIICFRERYWETITFQNLVRSYHHTIREKPSLNIVIFDNTDLTQWKENATNFQNDKIQIHYFADNKNPGISAAINYFGKFAVQNSYDWICFLDQDTNLPLDFYDKYNDFLQDNNDFEIAFPKVYSNNKLISPSGYYFYRTKIFDKLDESSIKLKNVTAINSGLLIKTNFFITKGGYNKNLKIDFCDHEFIERLNQKNYSAGIIDIRLNQDFSEETNDKKKSLFRYKMYIKDLKAYSKNKSKILLFFRVDLPHLVKLTLKYKSLHFIKLRLQNNIF